MCLQVKSIYPRKERKERENTLPLPTLFRALDKMADEQAELALSRSLKNARGVIVVHLMLYQLKFYKTLVLIKRENCYKFLMFYFEINNFSFV